MRLAPLLLAITLFVPPAALAAGEPDARQAADELVTLTNVEGMLALVRAQTGRTIAARIDALSLSPSQREAADRLEKNVQNLLADKLSFTKMKESYVNAYTSAFTAEELQGLAAFYKTPLGRAYVKKLPELTSRMMDIAQTRVAQLEPEIRKMTDEFAAELNKAPAQE
jgi:uncharacterized protein